MKGDSGHSVYIFYTVDFYFWYRPSILVYTLFRIHWYKSFLLYTFNVCIHFSVRPSLNLDIHFSFEYTLYKFLVYTLYFGIHSLFLVYTLYFGIHSLFWYTLFILVYTLYFGIHSLFWYTLFILVYTSYFIHIFILVYTNKIFKYCKLVGVV